VNLVYQDTIARITICHIIKCYTSHVKAKNMVWLSVEALYLMVKL